VEKLIAEYFLADGLFGIAKLIVSFLVLCAIVYALWWFFLFIGLVWFIVWIVLKCRKSAKETEEKNEKRAVVEQSEKLTEKDYEFPDISFPLDDYHGHSFK